MSLGSYLNDNVVRFYHQLYRARNITFKMRRTRYMDTYFLLWPSADIGTLIENGGDAMDHVVATKAYKDYYFGTRESYHILWLTHQLYYDVTLLWQHFKFQYTAKALHEFLGHNSCIDIDCNGRIILILRKPTLKDNIYQYYDNITSYRADNVPLGTIKPNELIITIKIINEMENDEYFIDFDLLKYKSIEYQQYSCQIYVIHTTVNHNTVNHTTVNHTTVNHTSNHCQQSINDCHWF